MKEFKGAKWKWESVFTSDKSRAIRNKDGLICKLYKPSLYSGQDERYDLELEEVKSNQKLIESALDMFEMLKTLLDEPRIKEAMILSGENSILNDNIRLAKQLLTKITE